MVGGSLIVLDKVSLNGICYIEMVLKTTQLLDSWNKIKISMDLQVISIFACIIHNVYICIIERESSE